MQDCYQKGSRLYGNCCTVVTNLKNMNSKNICQYHHHHQWHCSPELGLGLPYGFRDDITIWVLNPTIDLVLVILIRPPETSSSEAGETRVRNIAAEFCLRVSIHACRVLLHAVNLRHGTDGFTSPPKGGMLHILSPSKSIVLGRV
jgi:hypothetical protein